MANLQGQELNERQVDILWEDTAGNPLLPASPIGAVNKALNTTNKRVIKAINELLAGLQANDKTVGTFSATLKGLVGESKEGLEGANVIESLVQLTALVKAQDERIKKLEAGNPSEGGGSATGNDGSFLLNL